MFPFIFIDHVVEKLQATFLLFGTLFGDAFHGGCLSSAVENRE